VGALDASLILYPAYFAFANGATAVLIVARRSSLSGVTRDERLPSVTDPLRHLAAVESL
jgi:hypothetical protein